MNIFDKQKVIKDICNKVAPGLKIEFDNSNRAKHRYGTCFRRRGERLPYKLKFYKPLFKSTLEGCIECAFHELAHYEQHRLYNYSKHDNLFEAIKLKLINDNSDMGFLAWDVINSKINNSIAYSHYELDKDYEEPVNKPKRIKQEWIEL